MLKNYIKAALRQMRLHPFNALTKVFGLSLGFAVFILISAYVNFEESFDLSHEDANNIYRVESRFYKGKELINDWPTSANGYAKVLREIPEIQSITRINWSNSERVIRYGDAKFREERVAFADSNFFSFFSYPFRKGEPKTALNDANSIVISESAAKRYFGSAEPLGKTMEVNNLINTYSCVVTGVFKDLPANSTMQFNFLISLSTSRNQSYLYQHRTYTFVKLKKGFTTAAVEFKFPVLVEKYKNEDGMRELTWGIHLVPLPDIHLNPGKQNELEVKGNRRVIKLLYILAFIILGTACVNYINLTTARALERAREVGVRKVSGASSVHLFIQFLIEAFLVNIFALLVAGILVMVAVFLLPCLIANFPDMLFDGYLFRNVVIIFLSAILFSGFYPSFILSRFQPSSVLKGQYSVPGRRTLIRRILVVFQFVGSLILISWTIAVYRQVIFMQSQSIGANINQTIVIKAPVKSANYNWKTSCFENEITDFREVIGVAGSGSVLGKPVGMFITNRRFGAPKSEELNYEMLKIDFEFMKLYELKLIDGRAFDKNQPTDSTCLVLNEAAVQRLGFASAQEAIGGEVLLETDRLPREVIGVIQNYHHQSLQQQYTPIILLVDPKFELVPIKYYSVKFNTNVNIPEALQRIQKVWKTLFPESSFDYFFLDEYYNLQYEQERSLGNVFLTFSILTVFIACIGLFGLTTYTTTRRTKEIGVRKALGASVQNIITLLTMESIKLILLSSVIAVPLSVVIVDRWLQGFAFRVQLPWWQILLPVIILLLIAISTIGYMTFKAASANPVKSLRTE